VTSATYADLLKNHPRPAIKSRQRGFLNTDILLQHDNPRLHTARSTAATVQDLSSESLPHPPYSPDLAPSDFLVFEPLKEMMRPSLSGPTKWCSRWCTSGCTLSRKPFFLEVFIYFPNAGILVWYALKTT